MTPAPRLLDHQDDLDRAVMALVRADPRLGAVLDRAGMPQLRRREPGYAGLALIVVGQQLSVASAAAVWGRVVAELRGGGAAGGAAGDDLGRVARQRAGVLQ